MDRHQALLFLWDLPRHLVAMLAALKASMPKMLLALLTVLPHMKGGTGMFLSIRNGWVI